MSADATMWTMKPESGSKVPFSPQFTPPLTSPCHEPFDPRPRKSRIEVWAKSVVQKWQNNIGLVAEFRNTGMQPHPSRTESKATIEDHFNSHEHALHYPFFGGDNNGGGRNQ